jgi:hypothetical protein
MVSAQIVQTLILVGVGIITAIILIFFGFLLGRKTLGEDPLSALGTMFRPDEKLPEEDVFEKALRGPDEGGYTDEELEEMRQARPYEGL